MSVTKKWAVMATAVSLMAVAGCGSGGGADASGTSTGGKTKAPKIAQVAFGLSDYTQAETAAMKKVVEPLGGSVTFFNANYDPQALVKACQDAVTSGRFNALVVQALDGPTGVPCATAAKAANIPVVALDGPIGNDPDSLKPQVAGVVGSVVTLPGPNGDKVAEMTKDACADTDPCQVIVEVLSPTDPFSAREVKEIKAQVPNAEVVQTIATGSDPSVLAKALPDALAAHPDANVFAAFSDTQALAAVPVVKASGNTKLKILGNGGSRAGVAGVDDGTLFATAASVPVSMAKLAANMLIDALNGKSIKETGVDSTTLGPGVLTKANIADFTPQWGAEAK